MKRVAIVGGGISGLTMAYDLLRSGFDCTLIESRPHLGGVIQSEKLNGCVIEYGPDSFLSQKPWAQELINELGIQDQLIGSNDHLRRTFVLRGGKMISLPDGVHFMVPTKLRPIFETRLFGWKTKAKIVQEWFRKPSKVRSDRSVAAFIRDHFGEDVNRYLAQPMIAGVYGGSTERLSVDAVLPRFVDLEERYGSVSRGLLRSIKKSSRKSSDGEPQKPLFLSLKGGMQQLTDCLAEKLKGHIRQITGSAEALIRHGGGFHIVVNGQKIYCDQVVIAVPAYAASPLVRGIDSEAADHLDAIPYTSSITTNLLYQRPQFEHALQGFGFLAPEVEQTLISACTWVNTKFSHRATGNYVVLRAFIASRHASHVFAMSDGEIASKVNAELNQLMGFKASPSAWRVARWPRAMAQYEVGHRNHIKIIRGRLEQIGGVYLTGNAYEGIGIPDCIRRSREIARNMQTGLNA